ncbi:small subunit of splicing factor U2af [Chloropicon roscoffensis]|uniref:Small subunit of splicing factor U2af n=1 Tax=Chloropicon roscoffensis TaxID=1461544 RepID=A0AAX4PLC6_9CHLO
MASLKAEVFGTEKDRVNCPFYFKIGACRHGERCSRAHNAPPNSTTVLFKNMYQSPLQQCRPGDPLPSAEEVEDAFEDFYEDVLVELGKQGKIDYLHVCDNLAAHLCGNVYACFREEEAASGALAALNGRYYLGRPIVAELSPVTNFSEACCREFMETGRCSRGTMCNFLHLKMVGKRLYRELHGRERPSLYSRRGGGGGYQRGRRNRSRSPAGYREETDEERRAKIARWNRERREQKRKEAEEAAVGGA